MSSKAIDSLKAHKGKLAIGCVGLLVLIFLFFCGVVAAVGLATEVIPDEWVFGTEEEVVPDPVVAPEGPQDEELASLVWSEDGTTKLYRVKLGDKVLEWDADKAGFFVGEKGCKPGEIPSAKDLKKDGHTTEAKAHFFPCELQG